MNDKKKYLPEPSTVYEVEGVSYGLDDALVRAIKGSIHRRLQSRTLEIPRLPQIAGRILRLSQNPTTDLDEIVRTIATDGILATRVMTVANSAAFGNGQTVDGLMPAVMRLGVKIVRDMVFAESIRLRIFSARSYRSVLEQSWKLSLGTAIACEELSRATGLERHTAFLLGLLHDTGKPVLVNAISEIERENRGLTLGEDIVEIVLSQLHEEVGAYVLVNWGMPDSIVSAAREHHRYRRTANVTPAQRLVYAGNMICRHLGIGETKRRVDFKIEYAFADLDLADTDKMSPILETVTHEVESLMAGF